MTTTAVKPKRLLLIVDPQIDFISGSLAVPHAAAAMEKLAEYIRQEGEKYTQIFVTTDFHPHNHCSFKEQGGQWPAHCVQETEGADIFPALKTALVPFSPTLLRKGDKAEQEEYSIFKNEVSAKILDKAIEDVQPEKIDLCGIAGDICVLDTYKDAIQRYSPDLFHVLTQYCPSLDGGAAIAAITA